MKVIGYNNLKSREDDFIGLDFRDLECAPDIVGVGPMEVGWQRFCKERRRVIHIGSHASRRARCCATRVKIESSPPGLHVVGWLSIQRVTPDLSRGGVLRVEDSIPCKGENEGVGIFVDESSNASRAGYRAIATQYVPCCCFCDN